MKQKYYSLYQVTDPTNFTLHKAGDGYETEEEAKEDINLYASGRFIVIEYYE